MLYTLEDLTSSTFTEKIAAKGLSEVMVILMATMRLARVWLVWLVGSPSSCTID